MPAPTLAPAPALFIVFNPGSGRNDREAVRRQVDSACAAAGREVHWYEIGPNRPVGTLARQAVADAMAARGIAVAAGGDGTINAVAQAVLPAGCAFGVLPRGTFNYFGRTHGIAQELEGSLAGLLAGSLRPVQAAQVNERVFLVNASLGLYARLLEDREAAKSRFGRSRVVAAASAIATLLSGFRSWHLVLRAGGREVELDTPTLFVGNNALQIEQVGLAEADVVEEGAMAAIALRPLGRWALFQLLVRAARGRMDDDPNVQSFAAASITIDRIAGRAAQRVRVAADGEIAWMTLPLVFRVAPRPLWLVVPPPALQAPRE